MSQTTYLWTPPAQPSLPVRGRSERVPVNRIFCVGRNYHAHAVEMGAPVDKASARPFYFTKTPSALVESGATVPYPCGTQNYHYEMELVVVIGKPGFRVTQADAPSLIYGYAAGLDMTRRDLQNDMKKQGRPWCIGKAYDQSAPIGPITPVADAGDVAQAPIWLQVNGQDRQRSTVSKLIWNIGETIEHLSRAWELQPGDLIYTGTPEGVGAVVSGDVLQAHVQGLESLVVSIR